MADAYKNIVEIPERGIHYFRHYFIPHEGNNHQPLVIRPTALKIYSIALILIKLSLTGFLYAVYPTEAQFAELTASKVFELTNQSRVENGLPSLRLNNRLSQAASAKAQDMVNDDYFEHTAPDGKKFWQWIKETGYSYTAAGENLAMDFTTAESAHNALMASSSHRNNILKSNYAEMGVAVLEGKLNGRQTTVLVEHFGTPTSPTVVAQAPETTTTPPIPATPPSTPPSSPPVQTPPPPPLTYKATFVGSSAERFVLLPGTTTEAWVDFKNTGTATWTNSGEHFVALNSTDPAGRTSVFSDTTWPDPYRPAILEQTSVRSGEVGRFRFILKAPLEPTEQNETFALVAENLLWLEGESAKISIAVIQPAPEPAPDPEPTVAIQEQEITPQETIQAAFNTTAVAVIPTDTGPEVLPVEETTPLVVSVAGSTIPDWQKAFIDWSVRFFWAFLIFLTVSLFLNIVMKFRVQHRHVILQTLAVMGLTTFMALVQFHFVERLANILIV